MSSIFTKIVNREIPSYKIAEDEHYMAFLDIQPLAIGHVLVIPKLEIDYIFDIDHDLYIGLMVFAKKVATALKLAVPCKRVGVAVIGIEVPHAHIHLIPLNKISDINFSLPKLNVPPEILESTANSIREAYNKLS